MSYFLSFQLFHIGIKKIFMSFFLTSSSSFCCIKFSKVFIFIHRIFPFVFHLIILFVSPKFLKWNFYLFVLIKFFFHIPWPSLSFSFLQFSLASQLIKIMKEKRKIWKYSREQYKIGCSFPTATAVIKDD